MCPSPAADETMSAETRTFEVDRDAGKIDDWIEMVGRRWGENQRTIFGARLCVAELAANVIEHGIAKSGRGHIIVTLTRLSDGIGIEFMDSYARFDPTGGAIAKQPASIDSATVNGRGLLLVHAYSAELAYRHDGIYNRVTLRIESRARDPIGHSGEPL
jgi:anti-sigma regulatory factor (Ser/Thr protein kinase)